MPPKFKALSFKVKRVQRLGALSLKSCLATLAMGINPKGNGLFLVVKFRKEQKVKVFVLNKHGEALMPCSPRKAKLLLRENKAHVIKRNPFTIQLLYGASGYKQDLTMGVDTGHSEVGISVVSKTKEVFSAVMTLRNDISEKMSTRRMYRRTKRNRLRYRKPRFNNRAASTRKGRLPPSVGWKVDTYAKIINQLKTLLPIKKLVLETGKFDMQKLKNPDITNQQYQHGVQYGYENVKAYVLARDNYKCQCGKTGCSSQLHVHHIVFRSNGGSDTPDNLITLCSKHHKELHDGKLTLNVKSHKSLKSATTMNVIRIRLLRTFPDAIETFGYISKANRYALSLKKSHSNDAFVIAGGENQQRDTVQNIKFKRKNNRSLQKNRNGFAPSIRRQRYTIQPNDIIKYQGKTCFSKGMQNKGAYLKLMLGKKLVVKSVKHIALVYQNKGVIYA